MHPLRVALQALAFHKEKSLAMRVHLLEHAVLSADPISENDLICYNSHTVHQQGSKTCDGLLRSAEQVERRESEQSRKGNLGEVIG